MQMDETSLHEKEKLAGKPCKDMDLTLCYRLRDIAPSIWVVVDGDRSRERYFEVALFLPLLYHIKI